MLGELSLAGNRGADWNFWESSELYDQFEHLSSFNGDSDGESHEDHMYFAESNLTWSRYMFRLRAFFVPPRVADYTFSIKGDDSARLYIAQPCNSCNWVRFDK